MKYVADDSLISVLFFLILVPLQWPNIKNGALFDEQYSQAAPHTSDSALARGPSCQLLLHELLHALHEIRQFQ